MMDETDEVGHDFGDAERSADFFAGCPRKMCAPNGAQSPVLHEENGDHW